MMRDSLGLLVMLLSFPFIAGSSHFSSSSLRLPSLRDLFLRLDIHLQNWTNPCEPNPCRAGTCELISKLTFSCHCIPVSLCFLFFVWECCTSSSSQFVHGPLCEKLNYAQRACESNPCYNQGLCSPVTSSSNFTCLCSARHAGRACEENLGQCSCLNGGTCFNGKKKKKWRETKNGGVTLVSNDGYRCSCPSLFTGPFCEHDLRNRTFCSHSPCQNNGTCILVQPPSGICLCEPGYVGEFCEKRVPFCQESPCRNNGAFSSSSVCAVVVIVVRFQAPVFLCRVSTVNVFAKWVIRVVCASSLRRRSVRNRRVATARRASY